MSLISYFNGDYIPDSDCIVHVTDRGFRYGDAVFDIQRTFNGKPFRVREHLERFMRSLKYARLDTGLDIDDWENLTLGLLEKNEHMRVPGGDFFIGQYVSRGAGKDALDPVKPTIVIRPWHLQPSKWVDGYKSGVHGVIVKTLSYSPSALESRVKHDNRLNFALAALEAADVDRESYPILTDGNGNITENIQGNVWIVKDGVLKTPTNRSSLQGDAQKLIFDLAKNLSIEAKSEDIQAYDMYTADELFFSNTAYCLMPISKMDNRPIEGDIPGPITKQLIAAWSERAGVDLIDQANNYNAPDDPNLVTN